MVIEVLKWGSSWYWRIRAANGKLMCQSETYHSKGNAVRAAYRLSGKLWLRGGIHVRQLPVEILA